MSSTCENCMRCRDHQDKNCMSNEKMRFHAVADEDFKMCMRVPQEFGRHLREIGSDTIKLNAPNGCIYDIEVCREMGEIVLRSGWDVFAAAHNLEQNDNLVFKFCGKASFKVHIYSSCCGSQKIASCINPHPKILEAVPLSTTGHHHFPNGNEMPCPGHVQTPAEFDYFTSGCSRLTKAQDKKVMEMARTIRSETPLYVAVMNKSNVDSKGCFISLPSMLMKDVGEAFKGTAKLEAPDSNVYSISAAKQSDDEVVLQSGWDAFVAAHHVQESDLIIFRHKGNYRLEVFILDRNGCQKSPSRSGIEDASSTQEMCDDSIEIIDPPHKAVDIIDLSSSSSDDDNIVAAHTTKSAGIHKRQLRHCAKEQETHGDFQASMEAMVDRTLDSQAPYIISRKVTLSRAQKKMVLEKVQAIRSRFPIFVAVMNRSSTVEKVSRLRFTMGYARRCLPSALEGLTRRSASQGLTLQLEVCQRKEWQTELHVQGGCSRARCLTTVSRGWAEFASDNNLELGDICLFDLVTVSRLKMKVHIIRKSGWST